MTIMPAVAPNRSPITEQSTRENRRIRMVLERSCDGMTKPAIPAVAITITTPGDRIFAVIAACPTTSAPTMDTACPTDLGRRESRLE